MADMFKNNKRWIILCLVIWLLFIGGISPMTQLRLGDVSIAGTGSVAIHNTDDESLEGHYYESIVLNEETKEVVFHDYPIRSLDTISFFITIDKGVLSFRNMEIRIFGLPIKTISKEVIYNNSVDKSILELNQSSDVVTINTELGQAVVELDMGLLLCISLFFFYFAVLLLLSFLITIVIRHFLIIKNACWVIDGHHGCCYFGRSITKRLGVLEF